MNPKKEGLHVCMPLIAALYVMKLYATNYWFGLECWVVITSLHKVYSFSLLSNEVIDMFCACWNCAIAHANVALQRVLAVLSERRTTTKGK